MGYSRITTGKATVGRNKLVQSAYNTIARTDTSAKNLFKLPAHSIVLGLFIWSPANSDAGTSASITVGKTGTNNFFLPTFDVKTAATGKGVQLPNSAVQLGDIGAALLQVVGIYVEAGTASTAGGPWGIFMVYLASQ